MIDLKGLQKHPATNATCQRKMPSRQLLVTLAQNVFLKKHSRIGSWLSPTLACGHIEYACTLGTYFCQFCRKAPARDVNTGILRHVDDLHSTSHLSLVDDLHFALSTEPVRDYGYLIHEFDPWRAPFELTSLLILFKSGLRYRMNLGKETYETTLLYRQYKTCKSSFPPWQV